MQWMRRCGCSHEHLAARPTRGVASYDVQIVPDLPGKARITPGTGTIQVDREFWARLTADQRAAVLAHEMAHDEDPEACERCADARAGARLRHAGWGARRAVSALSSTVDGRRVAESVLYGWQVANAAILESAGQRPPGAFAREPLATGAPTRYHLDVKNARGFLAVGAALALVLYLAR